MYLKAIMNNAKELLPGMAGYAARAKALEANFWPALGATMQEVVKRAIENPDDPGLQAILESFTTNRRSGKQLSPAEVKRRMEAHRKFQEEANKNKR